MPTFTPHAARINRTSPPGHSMHHSLRHDQTLFRDIGIFDPTYPPLHLAHRDARNSPSSSTPPSGGEPREMPSSVAPRGPERPPPSARSLPGSRRPPGRSSRSTSTAGRTIPCLRSTAASLLGYTPPSRHLDDAREGIAARIRETDTTLLVCLDDANYLIAAGTYSILLYHLLRLYERWDDIRGAGVFAVTSDLGLNLYAETDGPVRSVFHPTEVTFRSYAASEIRDILGDRIRQGLYPGVVPAAVLDLVARLTADAGDARVGLDLVRAAACGLGERGAPPLPDRSSKRRGGVVKGCLTTLDALFSNDRVTVDTANHNAARIWKVYGTVARKGDNTPERSYRRARVLSVPEDMAVVPMENLRQVAGLLPRQKAGIDLAAWLLSHGIAVRSTKPCEGGTLYALEECPFSGAHKDGAFAIQFANGAVYAGCHHASCGGGAQRRPELRRMYEPRRKKEAPGSAENPAQPPGEHRRRALAILTNGDPLGFILDTFNKTHVGDRTVTECLALSAASQSVENTNGLHVAVSGKGKSHACATSYRRAINSPARSPTRRSTTPTTSGRGRSSPLTISRYPTTSRRSATANFRDPIVHRTVTTDRQPRVHTIPERCGSPDIDIIENMCPWQITITSLKEI